MTPWIPCRNTTTWSDPHPYPQETHTMTTTHTDPRIAEIWSRTVEAVNALDQVAEALDALYDDIHGTEGGAGEAVAVLRAENKVLSMILTLNATVRGAV